jgi:hypothetical protein
LRVKKYTAGKDAGDGGANAADSREWVFDLLAKPRYRKRVQQLEALDLRRRAGCEPCLRALVVDDWTPETLYHVGWCASCRSAAIALGLEAPVAGSSWLRRRAAWLAVAAFAAIAIPLVGSQVIGNDRSPAADRGGLASTVGTFGTATTPGAGSGGDDDGGGATGTPVTQVPRSKPSSAVGHRRGAGGKRSAHKVLPKTT